MNQPNSNLPSLEQRLEKLEQWQKAASKYINRLKSRLETVESELQTKANLKDLDGLEGKIEDLESLYDELYDGLAEDSSNLEETEKSVTESTKLEEEELLRQFYERVDQQLAQESLQESQSPSEIENQSVTLETETLEEAEAEIETKENSSVFTELEFKTERAMLLLNRLYSAEAENQLIPVSAEELLDRYDQNERDFQGIYCAGVDLSETSLNGANFSESIFRKSNLRKIIFTYSNLNNADLSGCDLFEAFFSDTSLRQTNLKSCDLRQVRFNRANLEKANLTGANLSELNLSASITLNESNLSKANLTKANLRSQKLNKVNFYKANLTRANLVNADLSTTNLEGANLEKAVFTQETKFPVRCLNGIRLKASSLSLFCI